MTRNARKYLFDIARSIELIEQYLDGIQNVEQYVNDPKTQDATERRLITISEATRRLTQMGIHLHFADALINRRNSIVHQYDQVSPETVWFSIQRELPILKAEVAHHLLEQPE